MADLAVNLVFRASDLGATSTIRDIQGAVRGVGASARNATRLSGKGLLGFDRTRLNAIGQSLQTVGSGITHIGRTGAGIIGSILDVGIAFEESLSQVRAFGQFSREEMRELEKVARKTGESTKFTASESALAMKTFAQSGADARTIMDSFSGAVNIARASGTSLNKAVDVVTGTMAQFNLEADKMTEVADILAQASNSAKTNVPQISQALKFVGTNAALAGLSVKSTATLLATLARTNIVGGQAGRGLNQLLVQLTTIGKSAEQKEFLKKLRIKRADVVNALRANDFRSILTQVSEGFKRLGVESTDQLAILQSAFSTRAGGAFAAILSQFEQGGFEELEESLKDVTGAADEMGRVAVDNTAGSLKELKSATESLQIAFSKDLLPALRPLIQDLTKVVVKVADWVRENPELTKTIGKWAIGITGVSLVLGPLITSIGGLIGFVGTLSVALPGASAAMAGFASATAGVAAAFAAPAGIIAAVGAAIGVFDLLQGKLRGVESTTESLLKTLGVEEEVSGFLEDTPLFKGAFRIKGAVGEEAEDKSFAERVFGITTGIREVVSQASPLLRADPATRLLKSVTDRAESPVKETIVNREEKNNNRILSAVGSLVQSIGVNIKVDQEGRVTSVDTRSTGGGPSLSRGLVTEGI